MPNDLLTLTATEWQTAPIAALLIYLRGAVPDSTKNESLRTGHSLRSGSASLYSGQGDKVSARKLALFMAACCARIPAVPLNEHSLKALDKAIRQLQAGVMCEDLIWLRAEQLLLDLRTATPLQAGEVSFQAADFVARAQARDSIAETCASATAEDRVRWPYTGGPPDPLYQSILKQEYRAHADLLREIVHPFRTPLEPAWLSWQEGTVPRIAQRIHDDSRFADLPILADALEEAGCSDHEILAHLRAHTPHARGCWALDHILALD